MTASHPEYSEGFYKEKENGQSICLQAEGKLEALCELQELDKSGTHGRQHRYPRSKLSSFKRLFLSNALSNSDESMTGIQPFNPAFQ